MGDDDLHFPRQDEDFPLKEYINVIVTVAYSQSRFLFIPLQTADHILSPCKCHGNPRAHGHIKYNFAIWIIWIGKITWRLGGLRIGRML